MREEKGNMVRIWVVRPPRMLNRLLRRMFQNKK